MTTVIRSRLWFGLLLAALLLLLLWATLLGAERPRPAPRPTLVVQITAVQPYGPAYRAGLEVGDRILEIDGRQVRGLVELRQLLSDAGDSARLTVRQRRTGKEATVHVYPERGRIGVDARMIEAQPDRRYPY
jgi:C-terminal processing protease CtpA/Prc